jgi:hypothetical protein
MKTILIKMLKWTLKKLVKKLDKNNDRRITINYYIDKKEIEFI